MEWEITPEEKRFRTEKIIKKSFWLILFLMPIFIIDVFICPNGDCGWMTIVNDFLAWFFILVLVAILLIFFMLLRNNFFPYYRRRYILSDDHIEIFRGNRSRVYNWDQFEYFYNYSKYDEKAHSKVLEFAEYSKKVLGETFYLKKKSSSWFNFFKTFVVIYSEPDISEKVQEFLRKHLPEKDTKKFFYEGFISYKFK